MASKDLASKALSEKQVTDALAAQAPKWQAKDGTIRRTWKTQGWKATMMAANAVACLAEMACHHPDLIARYGALEVQLSTHDAGGITDKDVALAAKIDALLDWNPGAEGGALEGPPPDDQAAALFKA